MVWVKAGGASTGAIGCGLACGVGCGVAAAWVCGACIAWRASVNGALETMLIGTDEPIGGGVLFGLSTMARNRAACSAAAAASAGTRLSRGWAIANPLKAGPPDQGALASSWPPTRARRCR